MLDTGAAATMTEIPGESEAHSTAEVIATNSQGIIDVA